MRPQRSAILLLASILMYSCGANQVEDSEGKEEFFCGAENLIQNGGAYQFDDGKGVFGGSPNQVSEPVFEGNFALKLDSIHPYGMPINFTEIKAGEYFEASVWIKNPVGKGTIISGTQGRTNYTLNTTEVNKIKDSAGWSQYFMSFGMEAEADTLKFFLFSGNETTYFDNFRITRSSSRPALTDSLSNQALKIYIPDSAMNQLNQYKQKALEQEIVSADLKEFVNGFIIRENDSLPAEIRLKGDWTDHLENGKTSYRIKVDQPYLGLTDFSIQHPQTRNFMHEWFMHRVFDLEGLLSTKYDYLPVEINGQSQGIYALEEHFDEHLLENKGYVEGPILKLDERGFWALLASGMKDSITGSYPYFDASMITCFKENKTEKSKRLSAAFRAGSALLRMYKDRYPNPAEIVDLDKTARTMALLDLGNVHHTLAWHNRRYYYNPITAKLQLIGFDMIPGILPYNPLLAKQKFDFVQLAGPAESALDFFLLQDTEYRARYTKYCYKFSSEKYLDSIFNLLESEIAQREFLLSHEFPEYTLDRTPYYEKAAFMRNDLLTLDSLWDAFALRTSKSPAPKIIQPDFHEQPTQFVLEEISINAYLTKIDSINYQVYAENFHLSDVMIVGYTCKDSLHELSISGGPLLLAKFAGGKPAALNILLSCKPDKLIFSAANAPGKKFYTSVFGWPKPSDSHPRIELKNKFSEKNSLYSIANNVLTIKKGTHILRDLIYVPEGYTVKLEAGAQLDIVNQGGLIFNGVTNFNGTAEEPIIITSSDSSSLGITILNAEHVSITHTTFDNQDGLNYKDWVLNGGLTIYEGRINISHVTVSNSKADDAINLIRTDFSIEELIIRDTKKDALDLDFSRGSLTNSTFVNTPNDVIDSTGCTISISNITINNSSLEGGDAGDFGVLRIENEIKLFVPAEQADSVWAYLNQRYNNNGLYLKEIDSTFNSKFAQDLFVDQYYDNDEFQVLKTSNGVRHRSRIVLTDPTNRKNGRELMQLKVNGISSNILNRAEYKYPIQHYDEKTEKWDDHPFLGIVKRSHRQRILDQLAFYGMDGTQLHPTIRLDQFRKRCYLYRGLDPFATLTLDHVTGHYQNDSTYFVEMEMELNEINYTEGDSASRAEMEKINDDIKADLLAHFPDIKQDQTPKYNKAANALNILSREGSDGKNSSGSKLMWWIFAGLGIVVVFGVIGMRKLKNR